MKVFIDGRPIGIVGTREQAFELLEKAAALDGKQITLVDFGISVDDGEFASGTTLAIGIRFGGWCRRNDDWVLTNIDNL